MQRYNWLLGTIKKKIKWCDARLQQFFHGMPTEGYTYLRKVSPISPYDLSPIGSIIMWTGDIVPEGWEQVDFKDIKKELDKQN